MKSDVKYSLSILTTLLKANNDRVFGYRQAAAEAKDLDLQTVFLSLADESRKNAGELFREIKKLGGNPSAKATTTAGKVFRAWMDFKSFVTGRDRNLILRSCETGEQAIQRTYQRMLERDALPTEVRQLIRNQQVSLRNSIDLIANYRERAHYGFAKL